ncbi:MAG TPA: hypothetical protein VLG50_03200 [Candidatus Saccharimonadales bacterium]|nr:hypothetical protein [Candidatus Saccharimonadales bacterium]
MVLILRKYKRNRWEYKIVYQDFITNKTRATRKRGFLNRDEARMAAFEMMSYLEIKKGTV